MNSIRRYRFMAMALALCVAGATAPSVLMAQGSPGFAAYGHSHKKHKKSEAMAKKDMKKEEMSKKDMAKTSESKWHKKSESKWHKKEMSSKKMETKKAEGHMAMMGHKPPHAGMVWVNTNTKVYHSAGSKYYGNTKHGKWMTPAEAKKAGYKAGKN